MNILDLAHWNLLAAIEEHGTVSGAAASLAITQPAATQRLHEAERRLGVALTARRGRGLVLTEAGRTLAAAARHARPLLRQAESEAIWQGKRAGHVLRMAWTHFDPHRLATRLSRAVRTQEAGLSLQFERVDAAGPFVPLSRGEVDLALVPGRPRGLSEANLRAVGSDRLVAVFGPGGAPEAPRAVRPPDFEAHAFLTYGLDPERGWEYDRFFDRGRAFPSHAVKVGSTELICGMVAEGAGASILPRLCVTQSALAGALEIRDLDCDPVTFDWTLIHADAVPGRLLDLIVEELGARL